ncbi:hypothetical protein Aperf_G00000013476 [Anoplocephala perfoliata]
MAITIGGGSFGSLLFELCTGEFGIIPKNDCENYRMHYLNTIFFRLVPNGWIQGGAQKYYILDENFAIKHDKRGVLSMVNEGRNTNSSQFMIVLQPAPWMDYRYVAFGQLLEGSCTLDAMEKVETKNDRPCSEIKIAEIKVLNPKDIHSKIK